jgi:hypothetical protein
LRRQDAQAPAAVAEAERIAAVLEPELTRIVNLTMERVAAIEQQSTREAREEMAASEQDSREAVERSSRLVESVNAATGTVGEMTSALQTEIEQVTAALRGLHGLRVQMPEPSDETTRDRQQHQESESDLRLTEMFRAHITEMRNDGKPREEAERVLKRLKHGRRFLGMLDDIYLSPPPMGVARRKRGLVERLLRGA